MISERPPFDPGDRFRDASRAYFVYGVVYWIGGGYLALHGIGARGSLATAGGGGVGLGLPFVPAPPHLLRPPPPGVWRRGLRPPGLWRSPTPRMAARAGGVLRAAPRPPAGG